MLLAILRTVFTFVACLAAIPVLALLKGKNKPRFKKFLMGIGCRLVQLEVRQQGELADGPCLMVANHCSYLDILVLQQAGDGDFSFTPKREISTWPVFGWVASLYDPVYIDRTRQASRQSSDAVMAALKTGRRVSLFPEGTTNTGRHIKPFKSALLSVAERWDGPTPLAVQPVALRYCHPDGTPLTGDEWDKVAWYGDMTLMPHLMQAFRGLNLRVDIVCLPPLFFEAGTPRKAMARRVEAEIRAVLGQTLTPPPAVMG